MRIEGSGISCGVHRLFITSKDGPEELAKLVKSYNGSCAMVVAAIPTRRRNIIATLLDNNFEPVKNPTKKPFVITDESINTDFVDMSFLVRHHGNDMFVDDAGKAEQFVQTTIDNKFSDMAHLVMHHGQEPLEELSVFVRYMKK